jgi:hypothetical protein
VRGNPQALFGKRPTEKDLAEGTSPAVHFTWREAAWKRPGFTQREPRDLARQPALPRLERDYILIS